MSDIETRHDEAASRYEAYLGDERAGVAEYVLDGDRITLTHTEVPDRFGGHGVASAVVRFALDDARERGLTVVPRCPYVRGWIDKHPEYADLVA